MIKFRNFLSEDWVANKIAVSIGTGEDVMTSIFVNPKQKEWEEIFRLDKTRKRHARIIITKDKKIYAWRFDVYHDEVMEQMDIKNPLYELAVKSSKMGIAPYVCGSGFDKLDKVLAFLLTKKSMNWVWKYLHKEDTEKIYKFNKGK